MIFFSQIILLFNLANEKKYWTPDRGSYAGVGEGYTGFEWKDAFKPYDPEHPKFAGFFAEGIKVFAEKELS